MIGRIAKYETEVQIKAGDAIMRINKDIRFSKDKTPYNTHVAANISKVGKKDKSYPGFYFQLSNTGINIYGGAYMVENPTLQRIREHISGNLKKFSAAYSDESFTEKFKAIQGEQTKRLPAEFQEVAAKEPLIANKQLYYTAEIKPDIITKGDLPDQLMEFYFAGKKLNDFLNAAFDK